MLLIALGLRVGPSHARCKRIQRLLSWPQEGRGGQKGNDFQVGPVFAAAGTPLLITEKSHEAFYPEFLGGSAFHRY